MENNKRIVEINGVKLEVDLSTARVVDEFKVGDNVKVLKDSKNIHAGVITEFVNFKSLPTIVIAIFKEDYWSGAGIEFIYYNSQTEGVDVVPCCEHELKLDKCRIVDKFDQKIEKARGEMEDLTAKRDYFIKYFEKHFEEGK